MNKKSLTRNKKLIKQPKRILSGEEPLKLTDAKGIAKQAFNSDNIGSTISGITGGLGTIIEASIANAKVDTSTADNAIQAVNNFQPSTSTLSALSEDLNTLEYADASYNSKDFTVSTGEGIANMGKAGLTGFTTGLKTGGIWGGLAGLVGGLASSGGAWAGASRKAKREADRLSREAKVSNLSADLKAENASTTILENQNEDYMINQAAYGGPMYHHSGSWSNGLVFINEGGRHEDNPFGGVLVGMDSNFIPNLVEEGEIIYNDYVFSNRLKPSKKQLESSGLNKKYNDWTFAKIVEDLQKASAETPLDKISKESLDDMMTTIINMQEEVRMKKGLIGENRLMANGGHIFDGKRDIKVENLLKKAELAEQKGNDKKTERFLNRAINVEEGNTFDWSSLGMYAPIVDSLGKTLYNIAKPVDESNIIAEDAYRELPIMELPRLTQHKVPYKPIDRNALINPVVNTGRATAGDIQNKGTTGADVMNRLALNAYNTQKAIGQAYLAADQQDLANRMQNAQFNLGVDSADAGLLQAVQVANLQRAEKIAAARIADATQREQLGQLKGQAIDTTSTAAIQGLADLTRQNIEWNWIKNNPQYAEAVAAIHGKKANGGMLTRKKRRK